MRTFAVLAFLVALASLALQLPGLRDRIMPPAVSVTLPPMQVTVQPAPVHVETMPAPEVKVDAPKCPTINVEPSTVRPYMWCR